jgi:hypothetical protein
MDISYDDPGQPGRREPHNKKVRTLFNADKSLADSEKESCIDIWAFAHGTHVDWALLLVWTSETQQRLKRVGVAITYPENIESEERLHGEFEII